MFQLVKLRDNYKEWNSLFFAHGWLDTIYRVRKFMNSSASGIKLKFKVYNFKDW